MASHSSGCVSCNTQLGVISKLAEGALDDTIYVIDEDSELSQSHVSRSPFGH